MTLPQRRPQVFLTVGTQETFDRLTRAVDIWAAAHPQVTVFGQLGAVQADSYQPAHFAWEAFVHADVYQSRLESCDLLVGHAGMGSIISALTWGKPLVILPRRAALGEHRNDHQLATAAKFQDRAGVHVAQDEAELPGLLSRVLQANGAGVGADEAGVASSSHVSDGADQKPEGLPPFASDRLIEALRHFIRADC